MSTSSQSLESDDLSATRFRTLALWSSDRKQMEKITTGNAGSLCVGCALELLPASWRVSFLKAPFGTTRPCPDSSTSSARAIPGGMGFVGVVPLVVLTG